MDRSQLPSFEELCDEALSSLETDDAQLVLHAVELSSTIQHLGLTPDLARQITGALVMVGDDEYRHVWLTTSFHPYLREARYTQILRDGRALCREVAAYPPAT
jgi:hypothetical protein